MNHIVAKILENSEIRYTEDLFFGKLIFNVNALYSNGDINNVKRDTIALNQYQGPFSEAMKATIILHELAHATGKACRLNRPGVAQLKKSEMEFIVEELIAESVSKHLMSVFNLDTIETVRHSERYISYHKNKLSPTFREFALYLVDEGVRDAIAYILNNWCDGVDLPSSLTNCFGVI